MPAKAKWILRQKNAPSDGSDADWSPTGALRRRREFAPLHPMPPILIAENRPGNNRAQDLRATRWPSRWADVEDLFAPTTWLLVSEGVAETSPFSAILSAASHTSGTDEGDRCLVVHSGKNHQKMRLRRVEPDRVPSGHRPPAIQ